MQETELEHQGHGGGIDLGSALERASGSAGPTFVVTET